MTDDDHRLDIAKYWLPEPDDLLPVAEALVVPRGADGWCCFFTCPPCGLMETLEQRVRWAPPGWPGWAVYLCGVCRQVFDHRTAATMLIKGEWRRTRK